MNVKSNRPAESDLVSVQAAKDPIEQQILAAGNLSEAQVEAIRGFQRRKGLTFGEAAITLGLVRRDSLFLALSKRYNYPVLNFGSDDARFSRELVVGYQPFSAGAEAYRSVRSALATGPLSQGKNAFAIIGAHSGVGATSFAANLALSFAQMAVPTLLVDANLRKPRTRFAVRGRPQSGGPGRRADPRRRGQGACRRRYRSGSLAARRRRDCASSAGASQLQGIPEPVAKRPAQLRRRHLRHPACSRERRRLCDRLPRRLRDPAGAPASNQGQRPQHHLASARGLPVRYRGIGPLPVLRPVTPG